MTWKFWRIFSCVNETGRNRSMAWLVRYCRLFHTNRRKVIQKYRKRMLQKRYHLLRLALWTVGVTTPVGKEVCWPWYTVPYRGTGNSTKRTGIFQHCTSMKNCWQHSKHVWTSISSFKNAFVDVGNASASRQRHLPVERTADQKRTTPFLNVVFVNDYFPTPNLSYFYWNILSFTTWKLKRATYL